MNIIGDVAGRFDELVELMAKMPDEEFVFVGDLNDRGKDSPKVIDFVMNNPKARCVKSNHGDMLVCAYNYHHKTNYPSSTYDPEILAYPGNGLVKTLESYGGIENVPVAHIEWLANLPWFIETDDVFISHAPWWEYLDEGDYRLTSYPHPNSLIWNRNPPKRRSKFQVYGHNSEFWVDADHEGEFAMCIDNSFGGVLTGLHWPSRTIYTVPYKTYD